METEQPTIYFTSQTHPLRIDFVSSDEFPVLNGLGMTFAPGKQQMNALSGNWQRDLTADLDRLHNFYGVDVLVSVIETFELEELHIANLHDACMAVGVEWLSYQVVDGSVPKDPNSYADFVAEIVGRLGAGKKVVIHCKGGLGRTGFTAACTIVAATSNKIQWQDAMKMVRAARPGTIENAGQEQFLSNFWTVWSSRK